MLMTHHKDEPRNVIPFVMTCFPDEPSSVPSHEMLLELVESLTTTPYPWPSEQDHQACQSRSSPRQNHGELSTR